MAKPGLQRIEATLNQVSQQKGNAQPQSGNNQAVNHQAMNHPAMTHPAVNSAAFSFTITASAEPVPASAVAETITEEPGEMVQPFPVQDYWPKAPALPKFKLPSFSSHRHVANPNLAMGLLKDLQGTVSRWQAELQQLMLQIQALYLEGPIVDGWLESQPYSPASTAVAEMAATALRHAEVNQLMDYVEVICNQQVPSPEAPSPQVAPTPALQPKHSSPRAGYRLCGLDTDGQLWCRPCPPEQLPYVSLAIARYQKLRQLVGRKKVLEDRLSQLAQTLVNLHGQIQED